MQAVKVLLESSGLLRYLEDLLLLDAVHLTQLCRLRIVRIAVHECVDREHGSRTENRHSSSRANDNHAQRLEGETHAARRILLIVDELDFITSFFVQCFLLYMGMFCSPILAE